MSNTTIYLVSPKILKDEYLIDDNIEDKYILSNIQKGQRFIINGILGDDKYNEILNQVSGNTLSTQNRYLIDEFIIPVLSYYVMSEVVYTTAYKLKNLAVNDPNPNSDRFDELVRISKKYLKDSEQFQQLLRDYIEDNAIVLDCEGRKNVIKTGLFLDCSRKPKFDRSGKGPAWDRDDYYNDNIHYGKQ